MRQQLDVRRWLALFLMALLTSCGTLHGPQTTQDRLAYGDASLTAAYSTIGNLAERSRITKAEGITLIADADKVRAGLNTAKLALAAGKDSDANQALNVALAGLLALEKVLIEKGKQP